MKQLSMIACISRDRGLGASNGLLWEIPADQQFFKETTMGCPIVMGGNTFRSIGRVLPGRENVVLSRTPVEVEGVRWFGDRAKMDEYLSGLEGEKFIIGGASLYAAYLPEAESLYLTEVAGEKPADVYFPEFNQAEFVREVLQSGSFDGVDYAMVKYVRRAQ